MIQVSPLQNFMWGSGILKFAETAVKDPTDAIKENFATEGEALALAQDIMNSPGSSLWKNSKYSNEAKTLCHDTLLKIRNQTHNIFQPQSLALEPKLKHIQYFNGEQWINLSMMFHNLVDLCNFLKQFCTEKDSHSVKSFFALIAQRTYPGGLLHEEETVKVMLPLDLDIDTTIKLAEDFLFECKINDEIRQMARGNFLQITVHWGDITFELNYNYQGSLLYTPNHIIYTCFVASVSPTSLKSIRKNDTVFWKIPFTTTKTDLADSLIESNKFSIKSMRRTHARTTLISDAPIVPPFLRRYIKHLLQDSETLASMHLELIATRKSLTDFDRALTDFLHTEDGTIYHVYSEDVFAILEILKQMWDLNIKHSQRYCDFEELHSNVYEKANVVLKQNNFHPLQITFNNEKKSYVLSTYDQAIQILTRVSEQTNNHVIFRSELHEQDQIQRIHIFVFDESCHEWKFFDFIDFDLLGKCDPYFYPLLSQESTEPQILSTASKLLTQNLPFGIEFLKHNAISPSRNQMETTFEFVILDFLQKLREDETPFYYGISGKDLFGEHSITSEYATLYYSEKLRPIIMRYMNEECSDEDYKIIKEHIQIFSDFPIENLFVNFYNFSQIVPFLKPDSIEEKKRNLIKNYALYLANQKYRFERQQDTASNEDAFTIVIDFNVSPPPRSGTPPRGSRRKNPQIHTDSSQMRL